MTHAIRPAARLSVASTLLQANLSSVSHRPIHIKMWCYFATELRTRTGVQAETIRECTVYIAHEALLEQAELQLCNREQ